MVIYSIGYSSWGPAPLQTMPLCIHTASAQRSPRGLPGGRPQSSGPLGPSPGSCGARSQAWGHGGPGSWWGSGMPPSVSESGLHPGRLAVDFPWSGAKEWKKEWRKRGRQNKHIISLQTKKMQSCKHDFLSSTLRRTGGGWLRLCYPWGHKHPSEGLNGCLLH